MDLRDVVKEPLILRHDDTVSRAVSSIISSTNPEALVFRGDSLLGVLLSRDLVKKRITNPSTVTIESFVRRVDAFPVSIPKEEIANIMLVNDYKAVPIADESIKILRKRDLLKMFLGDTKLKSTKACDIMRFPFCVSRDDTIGTARSIFSGMNVIAIPVIEKENMVVGLISSIDLLKSIIEKRKPMRGEASGESFSTDSANVNIVMSPSIQRVDCDSSLNEISRIITKKNLGAVVVERDRRMVGVITPRDILRILTKKVSGMPINVSGARDIDPFIKGVMESEIQSLLKKLSRMVDIDNFMLHIDSYKQSGRARYSLRARLITRKGSFFGGYHDWDVTKALKKTLSKVEREFIKKKEKSIF